MKTPIDAGLIGDEELTISKNDGYAQQVVPLREFQTFLGKAAGNTLYSMMRVVGSGVRYVD